MNAPTAAAKPPRPRRGFFRVIAPVLFPQAALLLNGKLWGVVLDPAFFGYIVGGLGVLWTLYLVGELRERAAQGDRLIPWYSLIAAPAWVLIFFAPRWAEPAVLLNPRWCQVVQTIDWPAADGSRTLTLSGPGNASEHQFDRGSLTDPVGLGVPIIKFRPLTLIGPTDAAPIGPAAWPAVAPKSADDLKPYLAPPNDPQVDPTALAESIWGVLQQANDGRPLAAPAAKIGPVSERPIRFAAELVGGVVWLAAVVLAFALVAFATRRARAVAAMEGR